MAKLITPGGNIPSGPPPVGVRFTCKNCSAVMETTKNEEKAVPTVVSIAACRGGDMKYSGWKIPCEHCHTECMVLEVM